MAFNITINRNFDTNEKNEIRILEYINAMKSLLANYLLSAHRERLFNLTHGPDIESYLFEITDFSKLETEITNHIVSTYSDVDKASVTLTGVRESDKNVVYVDVNIEARGKDETFKFRIEKS